MSFVKLDNIYFSVGQFPLLDHVNFILEPKARIALIGRNGQGKSTLMKILAGKVEAETGQIVKDSSTKIALLAQDLPIDESLTVYEFVAKGLDKLSKQLVEYHHLINSGRSDEKWLQQLNDVQQAIEANDGWDMQQRIDKAIEELSLPADELLKNLSGGWKRKAALAQALVQQPELLLLDEPTNHLDLEAIQWLEKRLLNYPHTIMFITHDRALLRNLATQIVELDRGQLTSYPPDYDTYVERKEKALQDERKANAEFDKHLAEEEKWIRQGIKARRTRNEGRVRALKALRETRKLRQEQQNKPNFSAQEVAKQGKMVIQAQGVSFAFGNKPIVEDFNFNIIRGDKVAIVGPNGCGKTTLVKLLLKQLEPLSGKVQHSPTNQIAFFEQDKAALDPEQTLIDNVTEGDDFVEVGGKRKHIIGYLGDFLFSPAKCHAKVGTLSGGEKSRLLLAKLFSKPANLFVLDEPTNDLDLETLEVLEDLLQNLQGTAIVISHDREFIDNIATYTIGFDDKGAHINVGGFSDWLARAKAKPKEKQTKVKKIAVASPSKKLSYNEQRELEKLPAKVEAIELDIAALSELMAEPGFYQQSEQEIKITTQKLEQLEKDLQAAYDRWEQLDG